MTSLRGDGSEQLVVQVPVGGDRRSPVRPRHAGRVGEASACLLDDRLDRRKIPDLDPDRVDGGVDRALCDQHVRPEVAVAARVPRVPSQRRDRLLERERQHSVLDLPHRGDADTVVVHPGTATALGVPAAVKGGRRDDAEAELAVLLERDQRRPDRDPARVVPCAVDRIDDPPAAAAAEGAELLAEQAVIRALDREPLPDHRLDRPVGLGHRGQVGLRLDLEVAGAETAE